MYGKPNATSTSMRTSFMACTKSNPSILVAYKKLKSLMNHLGKFTWDVFKNAKKNINRENAAWDKQSTLR